ncbi:MAG: hypothetical protein D3904_02615 [Candidatus Electrothrix sp. EH2]|nr:hypothetical protein [Candidatus Electrothrix sp. EH2]
MSPIANASVTVSTAPCGGAVKVHGGALPNTELFPELGEQLAPDGSAGEQPAAKLPALPNENSIQSGPSIIEVRSSDADDSYGDNIILDGIILISVSDTPFSPSEANTDCADAMWPKINRLAKKQLVLFMLIPPFRVYGK